MTRQIIAVISLLVMILLISSISNAQECNELDDGRYKVKFKKLGYAAFEYILLIDNNTFIEYRDGKEFKGKIAENANCALRLDYLTNPDSLLGVQKTVALSNQPYFEFSNTGGKKISFRWTGYGGPQVTSGKGKFIKLK